jgi:hypothetical protein
MGREGLAEELASIAVGAPPREASVDTIAVQLDRSTPSSTQFNIAIDRDVRSGGIRVRPIQTGLDWCAPR